MSFEMDLIITDGINFAEDFLNLIKQGEFDRVKDILERSSLYHTADISGATVLHFSVKYRSQNLTEYLLDKGCDVNIQDSNGTTPLMIAVTNKDETVIKLLLLAQADVLKLNNEKKSALHILSYQFDMQCDTVQLLLQELKKKCFTSEEIGEKLIDAGFHIHQAVLLKDATVIEYMLTKGSSVNLAHPISKETGLHIAVGLDDLESVNVLLKYGANANALDHTDANPLFNMYRIYPEHSLEKVEILKALLSHGASMTSCLINGVFNTTYILMKGNRQAISILIEFGLDFNAKDNQSYKTVLHYLSNNKNVGVTEELRLHASELKINITDKYGQSPLFATVGNGNATMVEFYLKLGINSNTKHNVFGTSPLYYAYECSKARCRTQYYRCSEMLLQYNADPQIVIKYDDKMITILDAALDNRDIKGVKQLLAHLAILEQLGTPIIEIISAKINANELLKKYFTNCQRMLTEQISGRITLFHLLTSDKKKMARYLNDVSILEKLTDKSYRIKISGRQYYYNILSKRYIEGNHHKKLKNKAARIICKVFESRVHKTHLVVDKIIDYLNHDSLRQLSLLYYQLSRRSMIKTVFYSRDNK